jgi:hypothetical protein
MTAETETESKIIARNCIHLWQVWAWIREYRYTERTHLYIRADCQRCGTVSEGSAPIGARVGARLPGVGALSSAEDSRGSEEERGP